MSAPHQWRPEKLTGEDMDHLADLLTCVRCSACRETCPTYITEGREAATPRGRIALMLAETEGSIPLDEAFSYEMNLCLVCRNCEQVCPVGVPFGRIMEYTRAKIERQLPRPWWQRALSRTVLRGLISHPRRLHAMAVLLWLYQKSGLAWLAKRILRGRLRDMEAMLPPVPPPGREKAFRAALGGEGEPAHIFKGCVQHALFTDTNIRTAELMRRAGAQVLCPQGQGCCGALQAHAGDAETAKELARRNIDAFPGDAPIVVNAAGCGAAMKEYAHLLHDDPHYAAKARAFSARVKDLSEWLATAPKLSGAGGLKVTLQEPCHLAHAQRIKAQPRQVLRQAGLQLVDMAESDLCCGAAGIYNIVHPEVALELQKRKLDNARATGARVIVTANVGCLLHLQAGLKRLGLEQEMRVVHIADLLHEVTGR